jgi:hypothetical protein
MRARRRRHHPSPKVGASVWSYHGESRSRGHHSRWDGCRVDYVRPLHCILWRAMCAPAPGHKSLSRPPSWQSLRMHRICMHSKPGNLPQQLQHCLQALLTTVPWARSWRAGTWHQNSLVAPGVARAALARRLRLRRAGCRRCPASRRSAVSGAAAIRAGSLRRTCRHAQVQP